MTLVKHHGYLKVNVYKPFSNNVRSEFSATDIHEFQIFLYLKRLAELFFTFLVKVENTFSVLVLVNL